MINTVSKGNPYKGNPVVEWLNHEEVKPGELCVMARCDIASIYDCLEGYRTKLPKSLVQAIDERDGDGAGATLAAAYKDYREDWRSILMKRKK